MTEMFSQSSTILDSYLANNLEYSVITTLDYLFPKQALFIMYLQYKSFENTVGKGEIARNDCFLPIWINF